MSNGVFKHSKLAITMQLISYSLSVSLVFYLLEQRRALCPCTLETTDTVQWPILKSKLWDVWTKITAQYWKQRVLRLIIIICVMFISSGTYFYVHINQVLWWQLTVGEKLHILIYCMASIISWGPRMTALLTLFCKIFHYFTLPW